MKNMLELRPYDEDSNIKCIGVRAQKFWGADTNLPDSRRRRENL